MAAAAEAGEADAKELGRLYEIAKTEGGKDDSWEAIFTALRANRAVLIRPQSSEYSFLHHAAFHGRRAVAETLVDEFHMDPAELTGDARREDAAAVAERFGHRDLAAWLREIKGWQVSFKDTKGQAIRIKLSRANTLDMYVDGRQKVHHMSGLTIEGDTLTFHGERIMFSGNQVVSLDLLEAPLREKIRELRTQSETHEAAQASDEYEDGRQSADDEGFGKPFRLASSASLEFPSPAAAPAAAAALPQPPRGPPGSPPMPPSPMSPMSPMTPSKGKGKAARGSGMPKRQTTGDLGVAHPAWEASLASGEEAPRPGWLPEKGPSNRDTDPEYWGMTVSQWAAFIMACLLPDEEKALVQLSRRAVSRSEDASPKEAPYIDGYKICEQFVKPWTRKGSSSIALLMNRNKPLKAEIMISHAWGEDILEALVAVLGKTLAMGISMDNALWFCTFAQYQPGDEKGDPGPTVGQQLARDPFQRVIHEQPRHGMLVVHTTRCEVYERLWCCYEVNEAAHAEVMPRAAVSMGYLVDFLVDAQEDLTSKHVETRVAKCGSATDTKMIRGLIEQHHGYDGLNAKINDFRKGDLLPMAEVAKEFVSWASGAAAQQYEGNERRLVRTLRDTVRSAGVFVGLHCLLQCCDEFGFADQAYKKRILKKARETVPDLAIDKAYSLHGEAKTLPTPAYFHEDRRKDDPALFEALLSDDAALEENLRDLEKFPLPLGFLEMGAGGSGVVMDC